MARRKLNQNQSRRVEKRQQQRAERRQVVHDPLAGREDSKDEEGVVVSHYGRAVEVERPQLPGVLYRCHLRANMPPLVAGDRVIWSPASTGASVVVARLPRRSELCRPDRHGHNRPVAANIDYIVVVIAPAPCPHANLIDRYLVAAQAASIETLLLLNKTDLVETGNNQELSELLRVYEKVGHTVLTVSAKTAAGLDCVREAINASTCVLVGQSGVGKSSLVNTLLPSVQTPTGPLSDNQSKGTHTTTTARLFHINDTGGTLIDSPGIREFTLGDIEPASVINGFRELRHFAQQCRFRDCQHDKEPGCALLKAVQTGEIAAVRFASYRQIMADLAQR